MSKVICDVCGTTYPETATQCPICGCAKNSVSQTAAGTGRETGESAYSYVKGGRFSEKNVKKRNAGSRTPERRTPAASAPNGDASRTGGTYAAERRAEQSPRRRTNKEEEKSNIGLIVIIIILLIAIIAVVINLAVRWLGGNDTPDTSKPGTTQGPTDPSDTGKPSTPSNPVTVPCEDLVVAPNIEVQVGGSWPLNIKLTPENTTDTPTFTSSDPTVATVNEQGVVTGVKDGTATITITCGSVIKTCTVKSGTGSVDPKPTENPFVFEFNTRYKDGDKWDVTLVKAGEKWTAYKANQLTIAPELITWTSDNPAVCTVSNGIVVAVGNGKTEIHAQYNGQTYTCVVRCVFP